MEQMGGTKEHDDKGSSISQRSVRMSHQQQGSWEQRSIPDRRWQSHQPFIEGKWSLWPFMIQHNHVVFRGIWRIASHFRKATSANVKFVTGKQQAISYLPSSFATFDGYSTAEQPLVKANTTARNIALHRHQLASYDISLLRHWSYKVLPTRTARDVISSSKSTNIS